jgi:hypothetical protein
MARVNVYLPDSLHQRAKRAGLNVSELTQVAIQSALDRRARLRALDAFVGETTSDGRPLTPAQLAAADTWAAEILAAAAEGRAAQRQARTRRAKRSA